MKKALAILLVAVMALGMGVTGFAAYDADGVDFSGEVWSTATTVKPGGTITAVITKDDLDPSAGIGESFTGFNTVAGRYTLDTDGTGSARGATDMSAFVPATLAKISASSNRLTVSVTVPSVFQDGDVFVADVTIDATGVVAYKFADAGVVDDGTGNLDGFVAHFIADVSGTATSSDDDSTSTSTGTTAGIAKITSGAKIDDFNSAMSLYYGYKNVRSTGRDVSIDLDKVRPADEQKEKIWLYSNMFDWKDGSVTTQGFLNSSMVRTSKLAVRTKIAAGSKAVDSVTIAYDSSKAYIKVKFVTEWVNTGDLDFDFTVYLVIDGKRKDSDGEGLTFTGNLENNHISVYANDDYVDLSLGEVAEAEEFVSKIEVDLGNGVSIHTKFFKGKEYYGTATRDADDTAEIVFAKYTDVDNVVILKTVGLNGSGDYISLDTDYYDYYVYDKDLNYLGQATDKLKYSSRYYLAYSKLNVEDDYEGPEDEDYEYPAETGGDYAETNANANPGTGC